MEIENPFIYSLKEPMSSDNLGMTLRDYFANSAMNAYLSASTDLINHGMHIDAKTIAEEVYKISDEMLKERLRNKKICVRCKNKTSGENIQYCDKCILEDDYSN